MRLTAWTDGKALGKSYTKAFVHIDKLTRQAFPGVEIRWAYRSRIIRSKLTKEGKVVDSPEVALVELMDEGFTHVAVLSLHTIPGNELHEPRTNAQLFTRMMGGFTQLLVAAPLLASYEDMVRVADVLLDRVPPARQPRDAVIFMGHGSAEHPSDLIYTAMNAVFAERDCNVVGQPSKGARRW